MFWKKKDRTSSMNGWTRRTRVQQWAKAVKLWQIYADKCITWSRPSSFIQNGCGLAQLNNMVVL